MTTRRASRLFTGWRQFGFHYLVGDRLHLSADVGIQLVSPDRRVTGHSRVQLGRHFPRGAFMARRIAGRRQHHNFAADIAAMGDAMHLVVGGPPQIYA